MGIDREFDVLFDTILKPRLDALEPLRHQAQRHGAKYHIGLVGSAILFAISPVLAYALPDRVGSPFMYACWAVAAIGGIAAFRAISPAAAAQAAYTRRFKQEIVAPVIAFVHPEVVYAPFRGIDRAVFDGTGLFEVLGSYRSGDRMRGRIGTTAFEAAAVHVRQRRDRRERWKTVFQGLFVQIEGSAGRDWSSTLDGAGVEPRISVTSGTNRIYVAVHSARALFEPPTAAAAASRVDLAQMAAVVARIEWVVRELDIRADRSGRAPLHAPDDPPQSDADITARLERAFWDDD